VSSYIECAILFLLAQGCRNDIKKPSCLISCDRSSPSTGIADVSCRTKGNCDLFGARSPNTGQVGISCFTTSDSRANGPPINAGCDQADVSLDSLSGLLYPGGRFMITTESVHCPHLHGFVRSDVESCHGRIEQISPKRNSSCAHLPLEDDLSSSNDICDQQGDDSLDSFSGFSDPGGRFAITTKSVHCPHLPRFVRLDVESCHGRIEQISSQRDSSHYCCPVPSWVHVFGKSTKTSSLRTQGASVAYTKQTTTKKARHRRNRRARKKLKKQHSVLTEATIPPSVLTNLLSIHEIENEIIVFDGGVIDNPPI
jgi:hypothetical protein